MAGFYIPSTEVAQNTVQWVTTHAITAMNLQVQPITVRTFLIN